MRKSYANLKVLKGIDLSIADSEFITVLGPSGSGKTTVLRLIGGFTEPTAGQILLDNRGIARLPPYQCPFNTVFQDYALFPHLTVAENVAYGLTVRRVRCAEVRARTQQALERVALSGFETRYPTQLSGGQRQRVALARAIVCEPRLVLLDEPLGALDAELRRQMQGFLKRLQRDLRTTFLFVTHDQEEAITMADRIVVMDHGAIIQIGAPDDVYYRPNSAYVARFFGGNNLISCRVIGPGHVHTPFGPMRVDTAPLVPGIDAWLVVRPEVITIWRVVLPLSRQGAITGGVFTFVFAFGDFVTPQMVGGPTGITFGRIVYSQFGLAFNWPFGAALATLMSVVVWPRWRWPAVPAACRERPGDNAIHAAGVPRGSCRRLPGGPLRATDANRRCFGAADPCRPARMVGCDIRLLRPAVSRP